MANADASTLAALMAPHSPQEFLRDYWPDKAFAAHGAPARLPAFLRSPELESVDFLKRRVDAAARHAPLEQLAICPQCGFASSIGGSPMTAARQEEKLARLVEVARDIWR